MGLLALRFYHLLGLFSSLPEPKTVGAGSAVNYIGYQDIGKPAPKPDRNPQDCRGGFWGQLHWIPGYW
ncbi:hypothetical protein B9T07_00800 [Limnospira fusiformis CCALA 023]